MELRGLSHRGVGVSVTGGSAELQFTEPGKPQQLPSIRIDGEKRKRSKDNLAGCSSVTR